MTTLNIDYTDLELRLAVLGMIDMRHTHGRRTLPDGRELWPISRTHAFTVRNLQPTISSLEAVYVLPFIAVIFYSFNKAHTQLDMVALAERDQELRDAIVAAYMICDVRADGVRAVRELMYEHQRQQTRVLRARLREEAARRKARSKR